MCTSCFTAAVVVADKVIDDVIEISGVLVVHNLPVPLHLSIHHPDVRRNEVGRKRLIGLMSVPAMGAEHFEANLFPPKYRKHPYFQ